MGKSADIGRQTCQSEEDRHEQCADKSSQLLVDVSREYRRLADQYAGYERAQYGVDTDRIGDQRHYPGHHKDHGDHRELADETVVCQRISRDTIRRPIVKLSKRKIAVPTTLFSSAPRSTAPCKTKPRMIDTIIQQMASSMRAAATISWPTVRR